MRLFSKHSGMILARAMYLKLWSYTTSILEDDIAFFKGGVGISGGSIISSEPSIIISGYLTSSTRGSFGTSFGYTIGYINWGWSTALTILKYLISIDTASFLPLESIRFVSYVSLSAASLTQLIIFCWSWRPSNFSSRLFFSSLLAASLF